MEARHLSKIDPALRRYAARRVAKRREQVFVEVANAEAAAWLRTRTWIGKLVQLVDGYFTATVPCDRLTELAGHEGVIEIEAVRHFRPRLIESRHSIHGDEAASGGGVPDGRGVVIGFVDYGLDFTRKDFQNPQDGRIKDARNPDGITRIAYLWDQQLRRRGKERAPAKYGYGVEYSRRQIDHALRRNRPGLIRHNPLNPARGEPGLQGHGTHVAGIAAGNGESSDGNNPPDTYVGIAPAATLVFVNLNRSQIIGQVKGARGTLANSINIAHGVAYCFEKADRLGLPCVVNLSLGSNGGGHDGNMVLEWIIDTLLQKSGRAVVVAAGNEDGAKRPVHATGRLAAGGRTALRWKIGNKNQRKNDPNPNELEIWYPRGSALQVRLVAPGGEKSGKVAPGECVTRKLSKGETVRIDSDAETPWDGAARIHIALGAPRKKGIRFGTWRVELRAISVAKGLPGGRVTFDAWIERTLPADGPQEGISRFAEYDKASAINITPPATAMRAIAVASYDNVRCNPPISAFSSRGPTRDRRPKPELAAPGGNVLSTSVSGRDENGKVRPARVPKSGTSMAAPHVAGVVARMLGRNAYLTAEEIREILVKSATPPDGGRQGRWDPKWGYGMLNAARAVEIVERRVGSRQRPERGTRRAPRGPRG